MPESICDCRRTIRGSLTMKTTTSSFRHTMRAARWRGSVQAARSSTSPRTTTATPVGGLVSTRGNALGVPDWTTSTCTSALSAGCYAVDSAIITMTLALSDALCVMLTSNWMRISMKYLTKFRKQVCIDNIRQDYRYTIKVVACEPKTNIHSSCCDTALHRLCLTFQSRKCFFGQNNQELHPTAIAVIVITT